MAFDISAENLLTIDQLTEKLGVVRRTLELKRRDGKFPEPTTYIFGSPRWSSTCINRWLAEQQRPSTGLTKLEERLSRPFTPV